MRTVELFAGIGGFRVAADRLGWKTVWANDKSAKACRVYRDQFGASELNEGDFAEMKATIPAHDVLTGGFPCQPFSSAGKKEGTRDARGTLFHLIVDVLKVQRPKFFILENVKRLLAMEDGCHFATILGSLAELDYSVEWRLLNAMNFGLPQNRERIVILGERKSELQLQDPRIRLATSEDLSAINGQQLERLSDSNCWHAIPDHRASFPDWGLASAGRFFGLDLERFSEAQPLVTLESVLEPIVSAEFDFTEKTLEWIHSNDPVNRLVSGVQIVSNQRGGARMGYTIFGINGVAPTLTSSASRHYERYRVGDRYRRLTNTEYARIQGFPDSHCRAVSVYDQYALFGNAIPPPLVEWVMRRLKGNGISWRSIPHRPKSATLFDHAI